MLLTCGCIYGMLNSGNQDKGFVSGDCSNHDE